MMKDVVNLILANNGEENGILIDGNVEDYILKLKKFATIIPYYTNSVLGGFIAYYSNDPLNKNGYLTMFIVDKDQRGKGLGKLLFTCSIIDLINKGFIRYDLGVLKANTNAINLYENLGFEIVEDKDKFWRMSMELKNFKLS